ncbi:hypothetical protein [Kutzneria sp. NPDC052558]|uniref:hypothetical protein n=1 Tax=Kutzneria sp. NPDC052558 TaxID=3364121 RepID=UPI0037CAA648
MPFLLGPLGALRALPSPTLGTAPVASAARLGGVHRSLTGRVTVDRLAVRRTWTLAWPYLDDATRAYLDALYLGVVAGPLWLVDPMRVNRLPGHVAATGSASRTTTGFTVTAGTVAWAAGVPTVAEVPLAGGLSWSVPASGGALTADAVVPVAGGETVTASATLAGTVPAALSVSSFTAAGAALRVDQGTTGPPGTAGTRAALTTTLPATAAYIRVGVSAAASSAGGPLTVSGWQAEAGLLPGGWQAGGGAAVVVVDSLSTTYPIPTAAEVALTLLEV